MEKNILFCLKWQKFKNKVEIRWILQCSILVTAPSQIENYTVEFRETERRWQLAGVEGKVRGRESKERSGKVWKHPILKWGKFRDLMRWVVSTVNWIVHLEVAVRVDLKCFTIIITNMVTTCGDGCAKERHVVHIPQ